MRRWVAAGMLLALAACQPSDPLAQDRAMCADADAAVEPRVAACSRLIESGEGDDPARAEWQALRGDAYYGADEVTPALRAYEAALRLDESNARALEGRAGILLASGQLDAAEPLVDRLIEAGNASAEALRIKGDIVLQRGAYTEAIEHFDDAISADGRLALAYAHRARAKERLGTAAARARITTPRSALTARWRKRARGDAGSICARIATWAKRATMRKPRWRRMRSRSTRSFAAGFCSCAEGSGRMRGMRLRRRWPWSRAIRRRCLGAVLRVDGAARALGVKI